MRTGKTDFADIRHSYAPVVEVRKRQHLLSGRQVAKRQAEAEQVTGLAREARPEHQILSGFSPPHKLSRTYSRCFALAGFRTPGAFAFAAFARTLLATFAFVAAEVLRTSIVS